MFQTLIKQTVISYLILLTLLQRNIAEQYIAKANSAAHCIVMLGELLDSKKLPLYVIFLGTQNNYVQGYYNNLVSYGRAPRVFYHAQKKAWMDKICMVD